MLTERARGFLSTLHREEPLPTMEVQALIEAEGVTPPDCWLAFHENYAGYWEDLGSGDVAIWGLARATEGIWCVPRSVGIYRTGQAVRGIACADVHPSFGYEMRLDGQVLTPSFTAHTFDVRVERLAVWADFASHGASKRVLGAERLPPVERQGVLDEVIGGLIPEASDEHARYYLTGERVVFENVKNGALTIFQRP